MAIRQNPPAIFSCQTESVVAQGPKSDSNFSDSQQISFQTKCARFESECFFMSRHTHTQWTNAHPGPFFWFQCQQLANSDSVLHSQRDEFGLRWVEKGIWSVGAILFRFFVNVCVWVSECCVFALAISDRGGSNWWALSPDRAGGRLSKKVRRKTKNIKNLNTKFSKVPFASFALSLCSRWPQMRVGHAYWVFVALTDAILHLEKMCKRGKSVVKGNHLDVCVHSFQLFISINEFQSSLFFFFFA